MKIAFAHCRLLPGGAQQVLKQLIKDNKHTKAQIFTLISKEETIIIEGETVKITTTIPRKINNFIFRINNKKVPLLSTLFDYRNLIILAPLRAWIMSKQIKKYNPDTIIISSFAWSKNINTENIPTTLYLHSPMQYIWTHYDEYKQKITGRRGWLFKQITPMLRKWDSKPRTYDKVISNSRYTQQQAKKIYNIDTIIQYPQIHEKILKTESNVEHHNYFIYTGRLVTFVKEVDKIIQACNQTQTPLIIMGDGPDKEKLQYIAGETIIFLPRIHDINQRIQLIQGAKGLINITKESFGISTMEALLLGVPVLGYNDGATPELMDQTSGILINNKDIKTISKALKEWDNNSFHRSHIQKKARELYKKASNKLSTTKNSW